MAKTAVVLAQQRWEYLTITRRSDTYLCDELNQLGQSGWELVTVMYDKDPKGIMFWNSFLKRPAAQQTPVAQAAPAAETAPQPAEKPAEAESPGAASGFDLEGDEFKIAEE
jgi:hypothetical protein